MGIIIIINLATTRKKTNNKPNWKPLNICMIIVSSYSKVDVEILKIK